MVRPNLFQFQHFLVGIAVGSIKYNEWNFLCLRVPRTSSQLCATIDNCIGRKIRFMLKSSLESLWSHLPPVSLYQCCYCLWCSSVNVQYISLLSILIVVYYWCPSMFWRDIEILHYLKYLQLYTNFMKTQTEVKWI